MTTAAIATYQYSAADALPLNALKRRKVQKQHGFRVKSTYGHCIKDEVLIENKTQNLIQFNDYPIRGVA